MSLTSRVDERGGARPRLRVSSWMLLLVAFVACSSPEPQVGMIRNIEAPGLTERQLRIELHDLLGEVCALVEDSVDQMLLSSNDPGGRQNALRFKANAIPMFQGAAFNNDPVIGLIDLWAASIQAARFMESPVALEAMSGSLDRTRTTSLQILHAIESVVLRLVTLEQMEEFRAHVEAWAEDHPITSFSLARPSAASDLIERTLDVKRGTMGVIHDLKFQVDDLTARFSIYAAMLPKQARWQAEIVLDEVLDAPEITELRQSLVSIDQSGERLAEAIDELPAILATERKAVARDAGRIADASIDRSLVGLEVLGRDLLDRLALYGLLGLLLCFGGALVLTRRHR